MLSPEELETYLHPLTQGQAASVRALRELIIERAPNLVEEVDHGKWYGGLLTYKAADGLFVFALGPRAGGYTTLHMMSFYGSKELQARHGTELRPFQSGKSCIRFQHVDELPLEAIRDILSSTDAFIEAARRMIAERKR